jgi:urocanate hydratase
VRDLTTDPGSGAARHADAGYESAVATAAREHIVLPMLPGREREGSQEQGTGNRERIMK